MEWWTETRWYAIQAKPRREAMAAASLVSGGHEILLPKIRRERRLRGIWLDAVKPLFPGYLFARFSPLQSLEAVQFSRGVLRVVSSGKCPIPLEDAVIAEIRARMADNGCVQFEPKKWQAGDAIIVQEGPFQGLMGKVEREWDDGRRVMILLEALQQARVLIEKRALAPAA
jgi:transcriptional antiterminator RfaH